MAFSALQIAIQMAMALLFLHSALGKARDLAAAGDAVAAYQLLPDALAFPAAVALVAVETMLGLGLLAGLTPYSPLGGAGLLLVFAAAMGVNLLRGHTSIDCGCDPMARPQPLRWSLVGRNAGLAALLLAAAAPSDPIGLALRANAAAAGTVGFVLYLALTQLLRPAFERPANARGAT